MSTYNLKITALTPSKKEECESAVTSLYNEYSTAFTTFLSDMRNAFETNWMSPAAKDLADEIDTVISSLMAATKTEFDDLKKTINLAIGEFNTIEKTSFSDLAIRFEEFTGKINMNGTSFEDGTAGLRDENKEIAFTNMKSPMGTLETEVSKVLSNISQTFNDSAMFDRVSIDNITDAFSDFNGQIKDALIKLSDSLYTRLEGEQSARQQ